LFEEKLRIIEEAIQDKAKFMVLLQTPAHFHTDFNNKEEKKLANMRRPSYVVDSKSLEHLKQSEWTDEYKKWRETMKENNQIVSKEE